jgi:hypothetical protein
MLIDYVPNVNHFGSVEFTMQVFTEPKVGGVNEGHMRITNDEDCAHD